MTIAEAHAAFNRSDHSRVEWTRMVARCDSIRRAGQAAGARVDRLTETDALERLLTSTPDVPPASWATFFSA